MGWNNLCSEGAGYQPHSLMGLTKSSRSAPILITQHELAERSGATREKVNGHLRALEKSGMIELGRAKITVIDPAALQNEMERSEKT